MILKNDTTPEYTREIKIAKNKNKRARTITLEKSLENTHTHTQRKKSIESRHTIVYNLSESGQEELDN